MLEKRKIPLAVVSGITKKEVEALLHMLELDRVFTGIVSCDDVKRGKPAPDPYLAACDALGLQPNECAVFEDAPSGIRAAKAAGCMAIGLTSTHAREELLQAGADAVVESAETARALLENMLAGEGR